MNNKITRASFHPDDCIGQRRGGIERKELAKMPLPLLGVRCLRQHALHGSAQPCRGKILLLDEFSDAGPREHFGILCLVPARVRIGDQYRGFAKTDQFRHTDGPRAADNEIRCRIHALHRFKEREQGERYSQTRVLLL